MRLTRNWKTLVMGIGCLALAAVAYEAPDLLALVDFQLKFGPWVAYVVAAILAVIGVLLVVDGARRDEITVSEHGLTIAVSGLKTTVSWADVEAVVIERDRGATKEPGIVLVLVPTPDADLPKQPRYPSHIKDRAGFILMRLDEVAQGHDGVVAAMTAHAGTRFVDIVRNPAAA